MTQYVFQQQSILQQPVMAGSSTVDNFEISSLDEAVHELRQPLSVIEALAYYLELRSEDESDCVHLRQIQAMVARANHILSKVPALERC